MSTKHVGVGGGRWLRRAGGLARVAALTGVMLGVGVAPSQAGTIHPGQTKTYGPSVLSHTYDFFPAAPFGHLVSFTVAFQEIAPAGFDLTIAPWTFDWPSAPFNWLEDANPSNDYDIDAIIGESTPGTDYKCVQMTPPPGLASQCVGLQATGALPMKDADFFGKITVAIQYGEYGWPYPGPDPIDLGVTDNFSLFMLFADNDPLDYRLLHFPSSGVPSDITVGQHCAGANATLANCYELNKNALAVALPEPATVGGVVWGLLGLTVLNRRFKRRD